MLYIFFSCPSYIHNRVVVGILLVTHAVLISEELGTELDLRNVCGSRSRKRMTSHSFGATTEVPA